MENHVIVSAIYEHGRINSFDLGRITGLPQKVICCHGVEAMFGGMIGFDWVSGEWFYKGWS